MLLVCATCAPPIRRALSLGLSLDDVKQAEAQGELQKLATQIRFVAPPPTSVGTHAAEQAPAGAQSDIQRMAGPTPCRCDDALDLYEPQLPRCIPSRPRSASPDPVCNGDRQDRKVCNFCGDEFPLTSFPSSGDRIKPYCQGCTPWVRKGMQAGLKVQQMRSLFQHGGMAAVSDVLQF